MAHYVHHVIGGGTVFHVRPHLALCAPAYGKLARTIDARLRSSSSDPAGIDGDDEVRLHLTKMADARSHIETNDDIAKLLDGIIADPASKLVFLTAALCDYEGSVAVGDDAGVGKGASRLRTSKGEQTMRLVPADKVLTRVRRQRKDLFLVACKTTAGATPDEQYFAGLDLLKRSSANLVLANDLHTRLSMVVTPEQARYYETTDREAAIVGLVDMAIARSRGRFTRSTIVEGSPVAWASELVPASLRAVVDHCIARGAYKPFNGSTVGHFAVRLADGRFLTSRRKTDFNRIGDKDPNVGGLVVVEADGDDDNRVIAHGSRPSVGGQSQRIVFREHPEVDCIVHFHCPLRPKMQDVISTRSQWAHECGSHECGQNTSQGLRPVSLSHGGENGTASAHPQVNVKAVMLDRHGPNIVFHSSTDPRQVIDFIETTFDLSASTDGVAR